ncbi:SWI/SNF complex component snf12 [Myotisia sp. PD_48]|nr:SWI/SNF complex component snf12 [Myotisia sp. PD_48]
MNAQMQPNYRGYPQATHRSPATPRRHGPGVPMPHSQAVQAMPNPQMLAQQQRNAPNPADASLRRSRKPTDRNLPDNIDSTVIGDVGQQYKQLRDVEKRLDASMIRKRLDIYDSINKNVKRYRTLRLWISNTVENQPWQQQDANQNEAVGTKLGAGRYKVKIEGRLLDDNEVDDDGEEKEEEEAERDPEAMDEDTTTKQKKKSSDPQRKRFSHFFKNVTIDFDKPTENGVADLATINWNKPDVPSSMSSLPSSADFDSLEFSRAAEVNLNVTINLVRDENPERFQLSPQLASILDVNEETRAGIVAGIWDYVKATGLQESEEKRSIICDERLKAVFNRDKLFFPNIPECTAAHTSVLEPIKLPYTIRVDRDFNTNDPSPTIYDVRVAVEDPLRAKLLAITTSPEFPNMLRQVASLDDQVVLVIQALHHSKAKHSFYTAMSKDPANFIKRWVNSQRRDLETVIGETPNEGREGGMEFRRGGPDSAWDTDVARESVRYMLAKPARAAR